MPPPLPFKPPPPPMISERYPPPPPALWINTEWEIRGPFFELWLLFGTLATGIISAFIPAISAYNMDISSTLKKKI